MNAIIGGTSLLGSTIFRSWKTKIIRSSFCNVRVQIGGGIIFLQRHSNPSLPPHRINHQADIVALRKLKIKKIISINSVESLMKRIKSWSLVIPDDFLSIWNITTFLDKEIRYLYPCHG